MDELEVKLTILRSSRVLMFSRTFRITSRRLSFRKNSFYLRMLEYRFIF